MKVQELRASQTVPIPCSQAWEFFSDPRNLAVITPDRMGFRLLSAPPPRIHAGLFLRYSVRVLPGYRTEWVSEITQSRAPEYFVDEQRVGPYRLWHHEHFLKPVPGGTLVEDVVHYALPFGLPGRLLAGAFVRGELETIFAFRARALRDRFGPA